MVSTSGSQLLAQDAVKTLRELLLPLTWILTPNLDEARVLLQDASIEVPDIKEVDDLVKMARSVQKLGPRYVLLKGGHMPLTKARKVPSDQDSTKHVVVDILVNSDGHAEIFDTEYVDSKDTHGTGCSLACEILCSPSSAMITDGVLL